MELGRRCFDLLFVLFVVDIPLVVASLIPLTVEHVNLNKTLSNEKKSI